MSALATATTAVLTTSSGVPTWASEILALGGTNAALTQAMEVFFILLQAQVQF